MVGKIDRLAGFARQPINLPIYSPPQDRSEGGDPPNGGEGAGLGGVDDVDLEKASVTITVSEGAVKINGQLTWQDIMHAQNLHTRRVWWQQVIWYAAIVALVAGFLSAMIPDVRANGTGVLLDYLWLPIVIVLSLFLFYYVLLPRSVRQLYEQKKEMSAPFQYDITPGGLAVSNAFGRSERPWSDFQKWKEDRNFLLLYFSNMQFIIVPKRLCTPEQVEELRADLRENHVPQLGVVTRRSVIITAVIVFWLLVGAVIYVLTVKPSL